MTAALPERARTKPAWLVVLLCWIVIVMDGYDLIVYGTTLPEILKEPWGMTATTAGVIASLGFVGMMIGAMGAGYIADRLGRRKAILLCTAIFTVFTVLTFFAPGPEVFGVLRFLAGIGLGGLMPSANALSGEFVADKNRSLSTTAMLSGIPIGGSLAALLGLWIIPTFGWQTMYLLAGVGLILLVILWFVLPESPTWLREHGREAEAEKVAAEWGVTHAYRAETQVAATARSDEAGPLRTGLGGILRPPWLTATTLFALASLFCLFVWYGLGTWLPNIMKQDPHFSALMPNPLVFLLSLNIGAVMGSFLVAWLATRIGPQLGSVVTAVLTVPAILFLLTTPDSGMATMVALLIAGIGGHGTTCLVTTSVISHFPSRLRGTALGFTAGFGRVGGIFAPYLAGALLDAGIGTNGNFLMFAIGATACLATVIAALVVLKPQRPRVPPPSVTRSEKQDQTVEEEPALKR
jgi:MFS transporter, AAHS family, benzoate transport protein